MAYIGKTPTVGNFQVCDAISVVNNQAAYTMQVGSVNVSPESANHMIVSLNGVIQKPTDAFTVSGSTITFAANLVTGDVIDFIQILGNVLDLGVPSDATVTTAKIVNDAVTTDKVNLTGDVGINTTSPASIGSNITTLEITGGSTVRTGGVKISNSDKSIKSVFYGSNSGTTFGTETAQKLSFLTNNTLGAELDTSSNLKFNSGFGSVTTVYGCRLWVNFNGTGTLAIRASGGVSSVTDAGVGNYVINYTTNMPDANYAAMVSPGYIESTGAQQWMLTAATTPPTAVGSVTINNRLVDNDAPTFAAADNSGVMVSIFR